MKTLFVTVAAVAFSASAFAGSPLSESDNYGSVLFDQDSGGSGNYTAPTGPVTDAYASRDNFGSVLFDLGKPSSNTTTLSSPPSVGDASDDYGSVLYDLGARY